MSPSHPPPAQEAIVGAFRLGDRLGDGGMGDVYAARHARWGHSLALKLARTALADRGDAHRAFQHEVRAVAALDHPHVVRLYDQGVVTSSEAMASGGRLRAGVPWLAMERAAGIVQPPKDWPTLRRVLTELLSALAAAHAHGILHLDVKPSNLLVRDDGSHALADFGIVMLRGALGGDPESITWGSPPYMAPERFDGRPERLVEATDLYAVGCLATHLATGSPPFHCPTWERAASAHRAERLPPLRPRVPVPAGFADWLRALLEKRPGDRFERAEDAARALRALGDALVPASEAAPEASGATLTVTSLGEAVPVAELLATRASPTPAPLPAAWALQDRPRRLERVGLGLLGMLAVPFQGRDAARTALWAELIATAEGGGPRLVVIDGPSGVGRTRLGDAFAAAAAPTCEVLGIGEGTVRRALQTWCGVAEGLPPQRAWEAAALRLRGAGDDGCARIVADAALGGPLMDGWCGLVTARSRQRPMVLWVDDALSDPARLELIERVMRLDARVLVVAAAGDSARIAWPDRARRLDALGGKRVALAPLDPPAARQLLADWVGLGPELVADLADRCAGDVGLAIEVVREGVRCGRLIQGDRGLRAIDAAPLDLPEREVRSWRARLPPRGDAPLWTALERAAALGIEVDRERLARALDADPAGAERAEEVVLQGGLGVPTDRGWRWASPVVRELLLADAGDRLPAHHLACAEATDDAWTRGGHLLDAGDVRRALPDLLNPASRVIAEGRMAEAARRLRQLEGAMAGAVPEDDPAWGSLLRARAMLGPTHQGYDLCRECNERAVALARRHPDHEGWRRVHLHAVGGLSWLASVQLLPKVAQPWLDEEVGLLRQLGLVGTHHHDRLGWHALTLGDAERAMWAFSTAVRLATEVGDRHIRHVSDAALGVAMRHAGHPDAVEHLERAGAAMLEAGYLSARADLAVALGDAERHRGRLDRAEHHYQEALRAAAEGDVRADVGFRVSWALWLRETGQLQRALEELDTCQRLLHDEGPSWEGLVDLHRASVVLDPALPAEQARLAAAVGKLLGTGFVDPDVARSAARVVERVAGLPVERDADALLAAQRRALARGRSRPGPPR